MTPKPIPDHPSTALRLARLLRGDTRQISTRASRVVRVITVAEHGVDDVPPTATPSAGSSLNDQALEDVYWVLTHPSRSDDLDARLDRFRKHLLRSGRSETLVETRIAAIRPFLRDAFGPAATNAMEDDNDAT